MMRNVLILISCMILLASCQQHQPPQPIDVPIVQLIADPARWHGKIIRVTGVMKLEFEGDAIYLSPSDADKHVTKNAIALDIDYARFGIPEELPKDTKQKEEAMKAANALKDLSGKYVVLEGPFNAYSQGHLGAFSASMKVTRIKKQ